MAASVYFVCLAIFGVGLLACQHLLALEMVTLSADGWHRFKRARKILLAGACAILLVGLCWTHRILFFVRPLADFGMASARFSLAMAIKIHPGSEFQGDYSYFGLLRLAAEQGHEDAAMILVKTAPTREERQRWLKIAAKNNIPEAQYQLFRAFLKSETYPQARYWLEQAAANRYGEAQYILGKYYIVGNTDLGYEEDSGKAQQLWEGAAEQRHGHAMQELAWRYENGADGFPYDPEKAIALLTLIEEGYREGNYGLGQNESLAVERKARAKQIRELDDRAARGDPEALKQIGWALVRAVRPAKETVAKGIELLEEAAQEGDPELFFELGKLILFGRNGIEVDHGRGRGWWDKAVAANHPGAMAYVAPAYQNGRFGYPVDLLKSRELTERLVAIYTHGGDGMIPDPAKEQYWRRQLKYYDRLIDLSGSVYESPQSLERKAAGGDAQAQYQLGRQLMVSGRPGHRQQGIHWIEKAADNGHAEAQYQLVTYFERQAGIMRTNPEKGLSYLKAAAEQHHLRAMEALALGYYKGRPWLKRDLGKSKDWYERLIAAYESGEYIGEFDEKFIPYQRGRLKITTRAWVFEQNKKSRYENATPYEKKVMDIEEQYRLKYQQEVNTFMRSNSGGITGDRLRQEIQRIKEENYRQRDAEIAGLTE